MILTLGLSSIQAVGLWVATVCLWTVVWILSPLVSLSQPRLSAHGVMTLRSGFLDACNQAYIKLTEVFMGEVK